MTEAQSYWDEIKAVDGEIRSTKDTRFCSWLVKLRDRLVAAAISKPMPVTTVIPVPVTAI
jgi:hypothetical protein